MTWTCGDCGFYKEKLCGVAMQSGFQPNHAACQSFSTEAWKCNICGQPAPALQNFVWDHATQQLVCPNCYYNLPEVTEEQKAEEKDA